MPAIAEAPHSAVSLADPMNLFIVASSVVASVAGIVLIGAFALTLLGRTD